jgi:LuxR family maltose regulon positive regulatory protein
LNIAQADVLREWNRLEEAEQLVMEGITENQAWRIPSALVYGYHVHSQVRLAQGDLNGALELTHHVESMLQSVHIHYDILSIFDARRVKVWLAAGLLAEAQRWAEAALATGDLLNEPLDYAHQIKRISLARVWIAQGRLAEAGALLERLGLVEKNSGRIDNLIEILALQARSLHQAGQTRKALVILRESLSYAEPEGYTRKYLDEGPVMAELLQALAKTRLDSQQSACTQRLLAAFASEPRRPLPSAQPELDREELVEPLSEREHEVLRLICRGYSNQEISEQLVVTLNTVKKHNTNIFGKLGVNNRAQAILRARELELDR